MNCVDHGPENETPYLMQWSGREPIKFPIRRNSKTQRMGFIHFKRYHNSKLTARLHEEMAGFRRN